MFPSHLQTQSFKTIKLSMVFAKKQSDTRHSKLAMFRPKIPAEPRQGPAMGSSRSQRTNQIAPIQAGESTPQAMLPPESKFSGKLFLLLFAFHLVLSIVGIVFLVVRAASGGKFRPLDWFLPLFTALAVAIVFSSIWQALFLRHHALFLKLTFYVSPFFTFAIALILLTTSTTFGGVLGGAALLFSITQALYGCWVTRRMTHAAGIFSQSLTATPVAVTGILSTTAVTIVVAGFWSCIWISGAAAAVSDKDAIFILPLLINLAWTMLVLRNILHVTAARVAYLDLALGVRAGASMAYSRAVSSPSLLGTLCLGSALAPVLELLRDSARGVSLMAGSEEEFMFSCVSCYQGVTDNLFRYGNGWGFVHVAVHDKGFLRASRDTWEMFERCEMVPLIDSDLTSAICLLSGVTCGALCAIVSGSWMLATHRRDAPAVSLFAFLLGYFMTRITMAWPQACVCAYHVAYAENPYTHRFDSTIPTRVMELQGSPV